MRETLDKRPIIIRRAQEISVTLRSVPTIVTARTFCAFRDFPRGTRGLTFIYFRSDHSQHRLLHFLDTLEVMIPNAIDGKRKRNGRFISTKSKRKRVSLTEYEKKAITSGKREGFGWLERWEKNCRIRAFSRPVGRGLQGVQNKIKFDKHRT